MSEQSRPNLDVEKVTVVTPDLSRRDFFVTASAAAVGGFALAQGSARADIVRTDIASLPPYGNATIPGGAIPRLQFP